MLDYDYSENGYYFVTICSCNRQNIFGKYKNPVGAGLASARMGGDASDRNNNCSIRNHIELSPVGKIIKQQWKNIPNHYEHVQLDEYSIMPNHIHGILIINKWAGAFEQMRANAFIKTGADARPDPTVPYIIRSFKSRCTAAYLRYGKNNNLKI